MIFKKVFKISDKEYELLMFIRKNIKFGKVELVIHRSQPEKIIIKEVEKHFGSNNGNTPLQGPLS